MNGYVLLMALLCGHIAAESQFPIIDVSQLSFKKQVVGMPQQLIDISESFRQGNRLLRGLLGRYAPVAHVLLYGKSGTGKTAIAYECIRQSNRPSLYVTSSDILGNTELSAPQIIKNIFKQSRDFVRTKNQDMILVFDDMSDILGSAKEHDEYRAARVSFIKELEAAERQLGCRLFVITIVDTAYIHDAIKKCFTGATIEISSPKASVAQDIFEVHLKKYKHESLSFFDSWKLRSALSSRDMTPRDIEHLVKQAAVYAHGRAITKKDIFRALKKQ